MIDFYFIYLFDESPNISELSNFIWKISKPNVNGQSLHYESPVIEVNTPPPK